MLPALRPGLKSRRARLRAWWDLLIVDHGFLRLFYLNFARVTPDLYRSAQPRPADLVRMKRDFAIASVLCIRGSVAMTGLELEREACDGLGLVLEERSVRGREAPSRDAVRDLLGLFAKLPRPILVHCKSGADRSGFVAALFLLATEGRTIETALGQLSWRFGHLRSSRAGILDAFFAAYAEEGAAKGLSFDRWLDEVYDPRRLSAGFRSKTWSNVIVDFVLRREL